MIYFHENIIYLLEKNKLNKNKLSIMLNITRQQVQTVCKTNNPMAVTLIAISDIFKISIDDLLRIDLKQQK